MTLKVYLRPDVARDMERVLPASGARSKNEYVNDAIRERNERILRRQQIDQLRGYFKKSRGELRAVNRELRNAARHVDEN